MGSQGALVVLGTRGVLDLGTLAVCFQQKTSGLEGKTWPKKFVSDVQRFVVHNRYLFYKGINRGIQSLALH